MWEKYFCWFRKRREKIIANLFKVILSHKFWFSSICRWNIRSSRVFSYSSPLPAPSFKSLILLCRKASLSDNIGSWVNKTEKLFQQWTFEGRTYHALTSGIRLILSKGAFISIESLLGSTSKPQDLIESILNDWLSGCGLRVNWTWTSSIKAMFAQVNGRNCSSLIDRSEHFLWQMNIFLSVHLCDIKSLELRRWQMTEHH